MIKASVSFFRLKHTALALLFAFGQSAANAGIAPYSEVAKPERTMLTGLQKPQSPVQVLTSPSSDLTASPVHSTAKSEMSLPESPIASQASTEAPPQRSVHRVPGKSLSDVPKKEKILRESHRKTGGQGLPDRLTAIRSEISHLEEGLLENTSTEDNVKKQVSQIQKLLKLQRIEKQLGEKRLGELESTVGELERRKLLISEKISQQKKSVRRLLAAIESSEQNLPRKRKYSSSFADEEQIEAPRRKVMANLVDFSLRELETLKADLSDAVRLEARIEEEKEQLVYLFQDLKEQASVLELNKQLQLDLLKRKQKERISQLKNYQKLKHAQSKVEHLIGEFNARLELQKNLKVEDQIADSMVVSNGFLSNKGKLAYPVSEPKVVGQFGRTFDPKSGLYIFKKGIDIDAPPEDTVRSIFEGKIAFSGELPDYGKVIIVDHGDHYYSLFGHLGKILRRTNEKVQQGDRIGLTSDSGVPLYFEIRSRNVAVNPLQWLFN